MEWKDVKEAPDLYEISNTGILRTKLTEHEHLKHYDSDGYVRYQLSVDGKQRKRFAHRLVAEAYLDNSDNHPVVHHKNNIRDDNRVENLMWATRKYNRNNAYTECPHCGEKVKV